MQSPGQRPALPILLWRVARLIIERAWRHGGRSGLVCAQTFLGNELIRLRNRLGGTPRVWCPCCDWRGRAFRGVDVGQSTVWNEECPACRRHSRHRLLKLALIHFAPPFLSRPGRVLYFAPEPNLAALCPFRESHRVFGADLSAHHLPPGMPGLASDITAMAAAEGAFDGIFCVHVLEHVGDDKAALAEMHRILAPGGTAVVMVPFGPFEETIEFDAPDPQMFGHVRDYSARDFPQRVGAFGVVRVGADELAAHVGDVEALAIAPRDFVFFCTKRREGPGGVDA